MMTNVTENGIQKCHQYWKAATGKKATFAHLRVKTDYVDVQNDWTVTSLRLKNLQVNLTINHSCNQQIELNYLNTVWKNA